MHYAEISYSVLWYESGMYDAVIDFFFISVSKLVLNQTPRNDMILKWLLEVLPKLASMGIVVQWYCFVTIIFLACVI